MRVNLPPPSYEIDLPGNRTLTLTGLSTEEARMFAAAPDLLHALTLLYDTTPESPTYLYARSKAGAAIAKAEGRKN